MSILTGGEFDDPDVAMCYIHRPSYPAELYNFLLRLVPGRDRALDLGCGLGQVARVLADHFKEVLAVDPAEPMLEMGRGIDNGTHRNIEWKQSSAETVSLDLPCDVIVAASSIGWMKHDLVFPRLASMLKPDGAMAVVTGDDAFDPPWREAWQELLRNWLRRMGGVYDPAFALKGQNYQSWMVVLGERCFTFTHSQRLQDFIACQHSRATWTRARMGAEKATEFDHDMAQLLGPYARDAILRYDISCSIVWGRPLTREKSG